MMSKSGDVGTRGRDPSTFTFLARAPYQGPRRRELAPADVERFRRWLSAELRLSTVADIEVTEWVTFDPRETPHTTMISVRDGRWQFAFAVGQALRDIEGADLPRRAREDRAAAARGVALSATPLT
jgi:hypothetical protein